MIDSHAHVIDEAFNQDRDEVIARALEAGVRWIEIGTTVAESKQAIALAESARDSRVVAGATVGVHPDHAGELDDTAWQELEQLAAHPAVVAIGEVGLDYYRDGTKEVQLPVLERFVALAAERELPIVFHVRDPAQSSEDDARSAHADLIEFLGSLPQAPPGVIHTFSGTPEQAEQYLALDLYVSLSGVVTFKNARDMQAVAKSAPLDRLLIETDCPYLTPEPHRGERNEPTYVQFVAQKLAELRGVSPDEIAAATEENTTRLFKLRS